MCEQKLVVPSDTRKKCLANCGVVLQYLRQAGVSLYDDDGVVIVGDDVANGDKELTLSLLWNMFVHLQVCQFLISVTIMGLCYLLNNTNDRGSLQLPLLMKRTMLAEEICKIRGAITVFLHDECA